MDYEGPTADDLDNVSALNRCFLKLFAGSGVPGCGGLGERQLSEAELARLSVAPFLLFSFRESDQAFWDQALSDHPQLELSAETVPLDPGVRELTVAALGFLWQLSRRNPYAARIVSGAPMSWCQQLARVTLMTLTERAARLPGLLVPRFQQQDDVWRRLLESGVSDEQHLQRMSHQSALQNMLTRSQPTRYDRLPAAACKSRRPERRVAETGRNGGGDKQV